MAARKKATRSDPSFRKKVVSSAKIAKTEDGDTDAGVASAPRFVAAVQERISAIRQQQNAKLQLKLFPDWPDDRRGAPKQIIRSAVFGVVRRGRRQRVVDMPVASAQGTTMTITGWRLDQHDCDVWFDVMHLARATKPGTQIRFSLHSMLKRLGLRTDGAQQYDSTL